MGQNSFFVDNGWKKCEIAQDSYSWDVCRIEMWHDILLVESKSSAERSMFCLPEVSSSRRNVITTGTISLYKRTRKNMGHHHVRILLWNWLTFLAYKINSNFWKESCLHQAGHWPVLEAWFESGRCSSWGRRDRPSGIYTCPFLVELLVLILLSSQWQLIQNTLFDFNKSPASFTGKLDTVLR